MKLTATENTSRKPNARSSWRPPKTLTPRPAPYGATRQGLLDAKDMYNALSSAVSCVCWVV